MVDIRRGIRNTFQGLGKSAKTAGPLDLVFSYLDYEAGKAEGEDDIRAAAGAGGSGAGGIIGGVIGSKLGPLGAIAGNYIGSNVGGWLGDRADELFRGNTGSSENKSIRDANMSSFSMGLDPAYRQEDQYTAGDFVSQASNVGLGAMTAYGLGKGAYNTRQSINTALQGGVDPRVFNPRTTGKIFRQAMPRGTATAAVLLGGKLLDDALLGGAVQRGIGGVADAVTGNFFDFDGRGDGRSPQERNMMNQEERQRGLAEQRNAMRTQNNASLQNSAALMSPYNDQLQQMNDQMLMNALDREDYVYNRNLTDSERVAERSLQAGRENYLMQTRANQAKDLMNAYTRDIPASVTNMLNGVFNARYT